MYKIDLNSSHISAILNFCIGHDARIAPTLKVQTASKNARWNLTSIIKQPLNLRIVSFI